MTVVRRGDDFEAAAHWGVVFPVQRAADHLDDVIGQVGEIADRLVSHFSVLSVAATQQVGPVDLSLVMASCGDDMDRAGAAWHAVFLVLI